MTKSAFVAIVGRPNVGKSSLLNALLGEKIAIVSDKPQTTRTRITGVLTQGETQFVFIDTPGLHRPRTKLSEYMVQQVRESVADVDVAVLVTEAFGKITNLAKQGIPKIPEGWALDEDGRETTDVSKVYSVIPVGTYKGFGLALIIDILSGILFGGATGERAGDDCQGPAQLFIALDIEAFGNSGRFYQELSDRMAELKACRKAEGSGEILFPGELENITRSHSGEYVKLIREIVEELQM